MDIGEQSGSDYEENSSMASNYDKYSLLTVPRK